MFKRLYSIRVFAGLCAFGISIITAVIIKNFNDKYVLFFSLIGLFGLCLPYAFQNIKIILFFTIFYIPLSLSTERTGNTGMYLIIYVFILSILKHMISKRTVLDYYKDFKDYQFVTFWAFMSLISCLFFFVNVPDPSFFSPFLTMTGKSMISMNYITVITMVTNVLFLYLVVKYIRSMNDFISLMKILVISGFLSSLAGYVQVYADQMYIFEYIISGFREKWHHRAAGTMIGFEEFSEYLALLLFLSSIIISATERNDKIRFFTIFFTINFCFLLVLTQTRGIFISIVSGFVYSIFLLIYLKKISMATKILKIAAALSIFLFGFIFLANSVLPQDVNFNFLERFYELKTINIQEGDFDTRTTSWFGGVFYISQMNFSEKMFGIGFSYRETTTPLHYPHNLYLSYIITYGFVGFFTFLLFLYGIFRISISTIRMSFKTDSKAMILTSLLLNIYFVIFLIDQLKIEFIRRDRYQNIMWVFWASIIVFHRVVKNHIHQVKKHEAGSNPNRLQVRIEG